MNLPLFFQVIQAVVIVLFPALAIWGAKRSRLIDWLSPVAMCYLMGIVMANIKVVPVDVGLSTLVTEGTVLLAIPLLLFSTDFLQWLKMARSTVISFSLSIVSVLIMASLASLLFSGTDLESNKIAGMLVGVYTGGTPNMNAIGLALGVSQEMLILVNAADLVLGASYFFLLMTVAHRILLLFLPAFKGDKGQAAGWGEGLLAGTGSGATLRQLVVAFFAAVMIAGISIGFSWAVLQAVSVAVVILCATSLGILGSFVRRIRNIKGTYELGQYLLLMFCVAIGMLADIEKILIAGPVIFGFCALVMFGSIFLHFALAALFRIDADTVIITSTAAIFGPPFVGPIAGVLKNRHIVVSGLTSGLIGLAVGNYLGIGLAWILGK